MFKRNLIIAIILSLIVGFGAGYISGLVQWSVKDVTIFKNSKVIQYWQLAARGEIIKIAERTLTLSSENDILSIPIGQEARISRMALNQETQKYDEQEIEFQDLGVGDRVYIEASLKAGGVLEGIHVIVLP